MIAYFNQISFKFERKGTEAQSKSETASNNKARGRIGEPSDGRECKIGFKRLGDCKDRKDPSFKS